jgi:hypothetical protein
MPIQSKGAPRPRTDASHTSKLATQLVNVFLDGGIVRIGNSRVTIANFVYMSVCFTKRNLKKRDSHL